MKLGPGRCATGTNPTLESTSFFNARSRRLVHVEVPKHVHPRKPKNAGRFDGTTGLIQRVHVGLQSKDASKGTRTTARRRTPHD